MNREVNLNFEIFRIVNNSSFTLSPNYVNF